MSSCDHCNTNKAATEQTYQIVCPNCKGTTFLQEKDFLCLGTEAKAAIDSGDEAAIKTALDAFAVRNGIEMPGLPCTGCGHPMSIGGFRRNGPTLLELQQKVAKKEVLELHSEQDPLMLALMKVRRDLPSQNHWHGETGTMRISSTLRWLVSPVMGFLRSVPLRSFDLEFLGSVSVFRAPGAMADKNNGSNSNNTGIMKLGVSTWLRNKLLRVFPLALAADAPVSLLVTLLITYLWISGMMLVHHCPHPKTEEQLEAEKEVLWHWLSGGFAVSMEVLLGVWASLIVTLDALMANVFMYWTIIREPGYILPSEERRRDMTEFIETKGAMANIDNFRNGGAAAGEAAAASAAENAEDQQKREQQETKQHGKIDLMMIAQGLGLATVAPAVATAAALSGVAGASPMMGNQSSSTAAAAAAAAPSAAPSDPNVVQVSGGYKTDEQRQEEEDRDRRRMLQEKESLEKLQANAPAGSAWEYEQMEKEHFEDNFATTSYCTVCKVQRPPRTYHCKVCNLCVMEHDHHCVVIGACVGKRNTVLFYGFLMTATSATFFNAMQSIFFFLATSSTYSLTAKFMLLVQTVVSAVLVGWIGMLWLRHAHGFRSNRTAREMIKLILDRKKECEAEPELKEKYRNDQYMCFPGSPSRDEGARNVKYFWGRALEPSLLASSDNSLV